MAGVDGRIEGQNGRLLRIRDMLAKPPSDTSLLVGHQLGDGPPTPIGEWPRRELVPALADDLDALLQQLHEDSERHETIFQFVFLGPPSEQFPNGRSLRVRKFNMRSSLNIDVGAGIAAEMNGTDRASNILAQQVALQVARMHLAGIQQNQEMFFRVIDMLTDRNVSSTREADDARSQFHELRELVVDMREAQAEATTPPENMSEAQKQFWELAQKSLPMVVARLLGSGAQ